MGNEEDFVMQPCTRKVVYSTILGQGILGCMGNEEGFVFAALSQESGILHRVGAGLQGKSLQIPHHTHDMYIS